MYMCLCSENTLDMHVCNKKMLHKIYICMYRYKNTLDMHVCSKNTSQSIYMYV